MAESEEVVIALVIYLIATLLLSYLFITTLIKTICFEGNQCIYPQSNYKRRETMYIWSSVLCITLFWLRTIIALIYYIIITIEPNGIDKYGNLLQIGWIFYLIAIWLMLLSFVSRIDYTFKGEQKLQFSSLSITVLYTLLIMLLILLLTLGITNLSSAYDSALYIGYAALIFHFIFCCFFSYLLFVKIFIFMQSRLNEQIKLSGINEKYNDDNDNETETNVSLIKSDAISAITKFTLLMFMGIISTYIASILIFLDAEFLWSQIILNNKDTDLFILSSMFLAFDIMINAMSAYLLFGFNDKKYYFVCNSCHKCCQQSCVLCVYSNDFSDKIRTKDEYTNLILGEDNDNKEP